MTVGKDVSALFPDVVNCMQTDNLELKKLVYLYLMNYAKSQPDMAIMAVNTFVKVSIQFFEKFIIISFYQTLRVFFNIFMQGFANYSTEEGKFLQFFFVLLVLAMASNIYIF